MAAGYGSTRTLLTFILLPALAAAMTLAGCGSLPPMAGDGTPEAPMAPPALPPAPSGAGPGQDDAPPAGEVPAAPGAATGRDRAPAEEPQPGPHRRNLTGRVPILLYHRIGPEEGRWTRTPEGLYADLLRLYEAGFRPVRLRDFLDQRLPLAPGYAPVILTFDDGDPSHLAWDEHGDPAPDSAVGVLRRFAAEHPGFEATAVFFVNADPFGGDGADKARWLVEEGFEVENHTWFHADLSKTDATTTAREVGRMSAWIEASTGRAPVALALPFGGRPRHPDAALAGEYDGAPYPLRALLRVGSGPARSPFDPDFDANALPRIQVAAPEEVSDADRPSLWDAWMERLLERGDLYAH